MAPPAAAARSAPDSAPLAPSIEQQFAEVFDSKWYLEINQDVAAAGIEPLKHFIGYGEAEGRDPSPTFSTRLYREIYMQGEPLNASALEHYLKRGRDLGYDPDPASVINYRRLVAVQEQSYGLELPELRRHIALMIAKPLFVFLRRSGDREFDRSHSKHASGSDL